MEMLPERHKNAKTGRQAATRLAGLSSSPVSWTCLLVATFSLQGCAINIVKPVAFNPSKPIEVEELTIGRTFKQDGKLVNGASMVEYFEGSPATSVVMSHHSAYFWSGILTGAMGGALVGFNLGMALGGGKPNLPVMGLGAGLCGASYFLGSTADQEVLDATYLHNQSLSQPRARTTWLRFPVAQW